MERIGLFAGTFDPVTIGHENIIKEGSCLFDKLIVAICVNDKKTTILPLEDRLNLLKLACQKYTNVEVIYHSGMLVDLMKERNIICSIRGIRNSVDLEYEQKMHEYNLSIYPSMKTLFIPCNEKLKDVSSTLVRKMIENKDKRICEYISKEGIDYLKGHGFI